MITHLVTDSMISGFEKKAFFIKSLTKAQLEEKADLIIDAKRKKNAAEEDMGEIKKEMLSYGEYFDLNRPRGRVKKRGERIRKSLDQSKLKKHLLKKGISENEVDQLIEDSKSKTRTRATLEVTLYGKL